jgi:ribonuclease HI
MNYTIFTDGAYSQKNDEGAFAFVIVKDNVEIMRKAYKISKESNNRAELKAIIAALHKLPQDATRVQIISDSMYALNTLKGNWNRNANLDLFEAWDKVLAKRECLDIEFLWVKGHSGDFYNELCDSLCTSAMGYDANKEFEKYKKI